MRTIETQLRQYHVIKVGARHIGEPHDHKSGGGLEPLGPIGVYAYVFKTMNACNGVVERPADDSWLVAGNV